MGDTDYDLYDTPFDIKDNSELEGLQCHEAEGELATPQLVSLLARSLTVLLCVGGGAALGATIRSRARGSLAEAGLVMAIQIVWQVGTLNILNIVIIHMIDSDGDSDSDMV